MGMDGVIDITAKQRQTVLALLARHLPSTTAWVYGSRAKWTSRPQSDLDMVVFATPEQASRVSDLEEAFEESNLPFRVDLFVWDAVPDQFRKKIEREHVVLLAVEEPDIVDQFDVVRLGDVASVRSGYAFKSSDWVDTGIPVVKIQNVKSGSLVMDGCSFVSPQVASDAGEFELQHNDILIAMTGYIGDIAMVRHRDLPAVLNQRVGRFSIRDPNRIDNRFLFYSLRYKGVRKKIENLGYGSAQPNVSPSLVHSVDIPLPPLSEQRAIAHILGTLDDKIELNRRTNETLEAMARTLFKSWFVDFDPVRAKMEGRDTGLPQDIAYLFPDRLVESSLRDVPEGWDIESLSKHFEAVKGVSYKGSGLGRGGIPLHNLNSIHEGGGYKYEGIKFYAGKYADRHIVRAGDVIVANTEQGHDRLLIGYAAMVPRLFGEHGIYSHHVYRMRPRNSGRLSTPFLHLLLNSQWMHDLVSGYANGTTVNMLPIDAVQKPMVSVPPRALLEAFDALALGLEYRREQAVRESRALAALRETLLPKLISGETRVGDAERVVESIT